MYPHLLNDGANIGKMNRGGVSIGRNNPREDDAFEEPGSRQDWVERERLKEVIPTSQWRVNFNQHLLRSSCLFFGSPPSSSKRTNPQGNCYTGFLWVKSSFFGAKKFCTEGLIPRSHYYIPPGEKPQPEDAMGHSDVKAKEDFKVRESQWRGGPRQNIDWQPPQSAESRGNRTSTSGVERKK